MIEKQLDLIAVLSLKTRRAVETGRAFVPVRELFPTVQSSRILRQNFLRPF
jgi:hypothetical protein